MKELNFNTGLVTYSINGKYELSFNPTDSAFVEGLFTAFDTLDKRQNDYLAEMEAHKEEDGRTIFELTRKMDSEMRNVIDDVLGPGTCAAVFGTMNVYALSDGLPIWANLLLAIMDEIDTGFSRQQKLTNPRIEKYTKKYHT